MSEKKDELQDHLVYQRELIGMKLHLIGEGEGTQMYKILGVNADNSVSVERDDSWTFDAVGLQLNSDGTIEWEYSKGGQFTDEMSRQRVHDEIASKNAKIFHEKADIVQLEESEYVSLSDTTVSLKKRIDDVKKKRVSSEDDNLLKIINDGKMSGISEAYVACMIEDAGLGDKIPIELMQSDEYKSLRAMLPKPSEAVEINQTNKGEKVMERELKETISDLKSRGQKMTICQFFIMLTADSFKELEKNTETLEIIMRKKHIKLNRLAFQQENAMNSILPLGNSHSSNKDCYIKIDRALTSESTAIFCPFHSVELIHKSGIYYGVNMQARSVILFNRRMLENPNGFIFGVPGAGKGVTAKLEILYTVLSTTDEILILDPEGEYTALAELLGGEVIYIAANSQTHINLLDLTPNPDPLDTSYDPITAKFEFLLSFFSAILAVDTVEPIQKSIIDTVMRNTYDNYEEPTLVEYYIELEKFEKENTGDNARKAAYLRQALNLYVHGSMKVFSHKSNVNINKQIVVYNIKGLGDNLKTICMTIVLENIWSRIASNRTKKIGTRIYVDEMYLMFKSEQCAHFFYELYKRARKWGGIPTGITQNVDDLLQSAKAQSMLANTKFVLMLSQNPTDSEKLSEILKIPMETMRYVTNSGVGCGLLYLGQYGNIPFDNRIPTEGKLYKIISTKFGEE